MDSVNTKQTEAQDRAEKKGITIPSHRFRIVECSLANKGKIICQLQIQIGSFGLLYLELIVCIAFP